MKKWMYDSVLEAPTNCQEIFAHNKELTEGLVKAYCKKDYSGIVIAASGSSYNMPAVLNTLWRKFLTQAWKLFMQLLMQSTLINIIRISL